MIEPLLENVYGALPFIVFLGVSVYLVFGLPVAWSYRCFLLAEFKKEASSQPSKARSVFVSCLVLLVAILLIPELLAGSRDGDVA